MNATRILRQAAAQAQHRTPMIKFLGRRSVPESVDHTPHPHPASPTHSLPESFAAYRQKAQQHGPLSHRPQQASYSTVGGLIGGTPGRALGPVEAAEGEFFDRDDLPGRFRRIPFTQAEIDAIESGGASLFA